MILASVSHVFHFVVLAEKQHKINNEDACLHSAYKIVTI